MKNQHVELESEDQSVEQVTVEDQAVEMPSFNGSDSKPRSWIKRSLFLLSIIFFGSMCYLAYIQGYEAGHSSVSAVTQKSTHEAQPNKTKETSNTDDEDTTNKLPKPVVIEPKTPEGETKKPEEVNKQPVEEDKKPADESNEPVLMDNTKGQKYWKKFENNTELLIGISSVTKEFERRMLFRHYQIDPYSDYNITWRFFISNPSPEWEDMIKFENNTYGDIIILRNVEDTREVAREVKPFHFFLYVEAHMKKYQYVAKMDDDTFMNIPLFVEKYFNNNTHADKEYMGLLLQFGGGGCKLGQGWFYAFTWDLLLVLNQKFKAGGRNYKEEDYQVGYYFCQSGVQYKTTGFDWAQCHDLRLERVWDDNKMSQPMTNNSICVHQLKRERHFVEVGQCATANGWNNTCIDQRYEIGWGGWDP